MGWFFWLFNYLVFFDIYLSRPSITQAMPEINQIIKNNQRILIFWFHKFSTENFSTDRQTFALIEAPCRSLKRYCLHFFLHLAEYVYHNKMLMYIMTQSNHWIPWKKAFSYFFVFIFEVVAVCSCLRPQLSLKTFK